MTRRRKLLVQSGYLVAGALIFSVGVNGFVVPNRLAEGGVSGLSILLHYATGLPLGALYLLLNIPLLLFGWWGVGGPFILRTLLGAVLVSAALAATHHLAFPMPDDLLLASLYAGAIIGLGLGLMFRSEGSSGGFDILARFAKDRWGISVAESFLVLDAIVIGVTALYLGADTALYALIVTFIGGRVVDFIQDGPRRAKAVFVVSTRPDEVARWITRELGRGATLLKGEGAWTAEERRMVLAVMNRRELSQLKGSLAEIDAGAFVMIADVAEVMGEGFTWK